MGNRARKSPPRSILVISRNPWIDSQSEGNTLSNLFQQHDGVVSHLCCRVAPPENRVAAIHFSFSDLDALKSILNPTANMGRISEDKQIPGARSEEALYRNVKRLPLSIFHFAREGVWFLANWKSQSLRAFLQTTNPDAIFLSVSDSVYVLRIAEWISKSMSVPLSIYLQDDILGSGRSPLDKARRKWLERVVRRLAQESRNTFYITEELRDEYQARLGVVGGQILRKAASLGTEVIAATRNNYIRFVYAGNLGLGRIDTLLEIAKAIDSFCPDEAKLDVYSGTALTRKEKEKVAASASFRFHGEIPASDVPSALANADVLLHVESLDNASNRAARLSFSTKLVDCFAMGKCILAVGGSSMASMRYLIKNEAAITLTSAEEIGQTIAMLVRDPDLRAQMGIKALACARANHSVQGVKANLANL